MFGLNSLKKRIRALETWQENPYITGRYGRDYLNVLLPKLEVELQAQDTGFKAVIRALLDHFDLAIKYEPKKTKTVKGKYIISSKEEEVLDADVKGDGRKQ